MDDLKATIARVLMEIDGYVPPVGYLPGIAAAGNTVVAEYLKRATKVLAAIDGYNTLLRRYAPKVD